MAERSEREKIEELELLKISAATDLGKICKSASIEEIVVAAKKFGEKIGVNVVKVEEAKAETKVLQGVSEK